VVNDGTVAYAADIVARLHGARGQRAFDHAADEFIQLIGRVPDAAPHEISSEGIGRLQALAEQVIDRIEERATASADRPATTQALIGRVYEIRRLLEEVDVWRRHDLTVKPS
jgi:hypothetical protein